MAKAAKASRSRQGVVPVQGKSKGGGAGGSRQGTKWTQGKVAKGNATNTNPGPKRVGQRAGDAADVPGSSPGKVL